MLKVQIMINLTPILFVFFFSLASLLLFSCLFFFFFNLFFFMSFFHIYFSLLLFISIPRFCSFIICVDFISSFFIFSFNYTILVICFFLFFFLFSIFFTQLYTNAEDPDNCIEDEYHPKRDKWVIDVYSFLKSFFWTVFGPMFWCFWFSFIIFFYIISFDGCILFCFGFISLMCSSILFRVSNIVITITNMIINLNINLIIQCILLAC